MLDDNYVRIEDVNKCWYKKTCSRFGTSACTKTCKNLTQTKYLLDVSGLPDSKKNPLNLDISILEPDVQNYIRSVIDDIKFFVKKGYNIYMWGATGCGKTSWAVKILTNYFAAISETNAFNCAGLYVSVPSFLRDAKLNMTYKSADYLELLKTIQTCDIVVWDDIIQTGPTDYEAQWLYSYINERIFANKCNIFTGNCSPHDFSLINNQLHSRVCTISDCLEITGYDMRDTLTYSQFMKKTDAEVGGDC